MDKVCQLYNLDNGLYTNLHSPGVEKNNDDAKRHYFSSNLHDPVGEVLKAEARIDETVKHKRKKRKYTRKTPPASKQPRLNS